MRSISVARKNTHCLRHDGDLTLACIEKWKKCNYTHSRQRKWPLMRSVWVARKEKGSYKLPTRQQGQLYVSRSEYWCTNILRGENGGQCCMGGSQNTITYKLRGGNPQMRCQCCIGESQNGITHILRSDNGHGWGECCMGSSQTSGKPKKYFLP